MIVAGKMRHRAIIMRDTGATDTDSGDHIPAWTVDTTVWAELSPADPTSEEMQMDVPRAGQMWRMKTRYRPGNASNRRVLWKREDTLLNGAINASVTSIVMDAALKFDGCAGDLLLVGSELMQVVGTETTNTVTVKRGARGTTAATHADNTAAYRVILFEAAGVMSDDINTESNWKLLRLDS